MAYDRFFGFDLLQRKTLATLLVENGLSTEQAAAIEAVASLPTADPTDGVSIWNDAGTLKVASGP